MLCLDDDTSTGVVSGAVDSSQRSELLAYSERDQLSALNAFHGNLANSGNRWFDKSLQLIVSRDGAVGANFEHTPADGGAVVSILDQVYAATDRSLARNGRLPDYLKPTELTWNVDSTVLDEVVMATDLLKE